MKNRVLITVFFVAVFALGITVGTVIQRVNGYHYQLLDAKSFPFLNGEVVLSHTFESEGFSLLNPQTSVLMVRTDPGGMPITIYKAKCIFQESSPHIKDVRISTNLITWRDGVNNYNLTVKPVEEKPNIERGSSSP